MDIQIKTVLFSLFIISPLVLNAQAATHPGKSLPLDPAVRTGKLPNGFTYFIRHNEEPKGRVYLYLVNKVGSILETEDQRGLAHFMEHMSFNGTKHFPKNRLVDYLQRSGVRFGADLNAYTSFDETVYQLPLPTDNPQILKNGFLIMRDWAQEATLDAVEIDKERGVVLEEKRLGKGASERMQRQTMPVLLNHSRYADRLPIGLDTVLNHFKPEAIRRYYKDWYRPDLQALIVVGDVNVDQTEKRIIAQFSSLKNPVNEKARTKYGVELTGQDHFIAVTDPEMTATVAEVMIKHKAPVLKTTTDYQALITRSLFTQMLDERYQELSRQAAPPFIQGGASINDFMAGLNAYDVAIVAKPGELENGFKSVWRETERVRRFGFNQSELDRAKQSYLANMDAALKEKDKRQSGAYVQEYQDYFLHGTASPGIVVEYALVKNDLPVISLTAINALIKEYIKNTNRDIIIQTPEKDNQELPDEATVNSWIKSVEQEQLSPYKDVTANKPLIADLPAPGKIISERQVKALGITELTLSNGVKVLLKPTDFKNNEISFTAFAPGGTSVYADSDFQSAANAAGIIPSGGLGQFDANQLEKMLAGKQVSVIPYIDEITQGISGGATNNDLVTALQLTYLYFTQPRKDTSLFKNIIARSKASLNDRANDPNSIFQDTISAVMGSYNVRRTGPTLSKVDQISLDKSYRFYKERFADASGFTFVFVGSIDTAKIKPILEQYLGALPATRQHEKAINLHIYPLSGKVSKTVYKGTEPKASVGLMFTGKYEFNNLNNDQLHALAEVLEIRLLERLREEESGVYSPGVSTSYSKKPDATYSILVNFTCAPKNVDKLVASTLDEIETLKKSGPPLINLDKYKAEHERTMEVALKTNDFWLNYLNDQYQNNEDVAAILHDKEDMGKLTPAILKEAANKYLSGENYIRLVLMSESEARK